MKISTTGGTVRERMVWKKISENSSIHDDNLNYIEPVMVRIDSIFDYLSENVQMQL